MRKLTICSLGLLILMSFSAVGFAQSATPQQSVNYSAVDQFSPQANPNGTWSYGYTASLGSPFVPYTIKGSTCCSNQVGWFGPFGPAPGYPLVLESGSGTSTALDMDPGPEGEYSIVRWTAPSKGTWDFVGDFFGTGATTVDVHILRNSVSIYDNTLNGSDQDNFGLTITLKVGEKIDFAVGYGGAFGNDPTGFKLVVSPHAYAFTQIDLPGAQQTLAAGINNRGDVVGEYFDAQGNLHSFQLIGGVYSTIDPPGSNAGVANAINDSREIVGSYDDPAGDIFGFLLNRGTYTPINFVPGGVHANANGINNKGDIVGAYDTGDESTNNGFLLTRGTYTSIEVPDAAPQTTVANAINARGQIVGWATDNTGNNRGFLLDKSSFTSISFPGADGSTLAFGINSKDQIVGAYHAGPSGNQGFVLFRGEFVPIIFPGATRTNAQSINEAGQIVGFFTAADGTQHGFLAVPKRSNDADR